MSLYCKRQTPTPCYKVEKWFTAIGTGWNYLLWHSRLWNQYTVWGLLQNKLFKNGLRGLVILRVYEIYNTADLISDSMISEAELSNVVFWKPLHDNVRLEWWSLNNNYTRNKYLIKIAHWNQWSKIRQKSHSLKSSILEFKPTVLGYKLSDVDGTAIERCWKCSVYRHLCGLHDISLRAGCRQKQAFIFPN